MIAGLEAKAKYDEEKLAMLKKKKKNQHDLGDYMEVVTNKV
jgi:hypothetical protein